ncbi:MAG: peptidoglycan DD-metalloendopeptidase family protein [Pseudomonadota bacterium]
MSIRADHEPAQSAAAYGEDGEHARNGIAVAAFAAFTALLGLGLILFCFGAAVQSASTIPQDTYIAAAKPPAPRSAPAAAVEMSPPPAPREARAADIEALVAHGADALARTPSLSALPSLFLMETADGPTTRSVKVQRGDTFARTLTRAGLPSGEARAAANAVADVFDMRTLKAGQKLDLHMAQPVLSEFQIVSLGAEDMRPKLVGLSFRPALEQKIKLRETGDGFEGVSEAVALERRTIAVKGAIDRSLFENALDAGMTNAAIANFIRVFAYDVDFQRQIRPGDAFEAVFEADYDDSGDLVRTGDILFAGLTLRGAEKSYYRFTPGDDKITDFFDAKGRSARKFLMKTPVDGARLSSGFGMRRHPILGYKKAHKGVDFAAPRGTPIMAAGDGVVEKAGRNGSFGNYIRIRHNDNYKTAYAHMHRIKVKKGARVRQGQVIGTVGSTGRSTGPHLHYEVHKNGKQVNPMRLQVSTGRNLSGRIKSAFFVEQARIDALRAPDEAPVDVAAVGGALAGAR